MSVESKLAQTTVDILKGSPQYQKVRRAAIIFALLFVITACTAGYMAWQHYFHPAQPVTGESQQQAETPDGVEFAAKNAHINMLQSQLEEAAKQIASLYNRLPDTVIKTVPVEVVKTVEGEREKRGADFAIVTDPAQPDKRVDIKQIEKLPAVTSVMLNQYNIKAYPDHLVEGTYYCDRSIDIAYISKVKMLGKQGYFGPTIKYESDNNKFTVGARISVPL